MAQDSPKSHLFLTKDSILIKSFYKGRGRKDQTQVDSNEEETNEEDEPLQREYVVKKQTLVNNLSTLREDFRIRRERRSLPINKHVEYVLINFHKAFKDDLPKEFQNYGLTPVRLDQLNQSVLFAITNYDLFRSFVRHIEEFAESSNDIDPHGKSYSLMLLIDSFQLLTSDRILESDVASTVTLELIDSVNVYGLYSDIYSELQSYLDINQITYSVSANSIDLSNVDSRNVNIIVDNFDIISKASSHRVGLVRPSLFGTVFKDYDFDILPNDSAPLVGIIDTGVSMIPPLRDYVSRNGYDLTGGGLPIYDSEGHGTAVAGLVVLGEEFYKVQKRHYKAKAKIFPIKLIENDGDAVNISVLCDAIVKAYREHGVRIFNLSINESTSKFYNSAPSNYAYSLDKIAYENDLLILISAGNLSIDDIRNMQDNPNRLHNYPNHFFNPNKVSFEHCCEGMNICSPAESFNNLTIGALADNLDDSVEDTHLSLDKTLPAYYTRKFHNNYAFSVNGAFVKKNQINYNVFKPDMVFAGGDLLESSVQMQLLAEPNKYYERRSGTSFSTPLVASLIAQILQQYPRLRMQTIKAIALNSCSYQQNSIFLKELCFELKEEVAQGVYASRFEDLTRGQKNTLSGRFNPDNLYKYLVGHGTPDLNLSLFSSSNSVTFIVEGNISTNTHEVIELLLPEYMKGVSGKFKVDATICYSFPPEPNNHLGYCPLHISFGFFKEPSDVNLIGTEHAATKDLMFKSGVTWSDEYYPAPTKPFSNSQKLGFYLQNKDLVELNNRVCIVLRCVNKEAGIDPELVNSLINSPHSFSLVVRITEMPSAKESATGLLYEELSALNSMEIINDVTGELDADLDV